MKFRTSFVTNSSSSSFIIAGVKIKEGEVDWEKAEDLGVDLTNTDYAQVVGKYIKRWEDGIGEVSLDRLDLIIKDARNGVEKCGLNPDDVRIYMGTEYC